MQTLHSLRSLRALRAISLGLRPSRWQTRSPAAKWETAPPLSNPLRPTSAVGSRSAARQNRLAPDTLPGAALSVAAGQRRPRKTGPQGVPVPGQECASVSGDRLLAWNGSGAGRTGTACTQMGIARAGQVQLGRCRLLPCSFSTNEPRNASVQIRYWGRGAHALPPPQGAILTLAMLSGPPALAGVRQRQRKPGTIYTSEHTIRASVRIETVAVWGSGKGELRKRYPRLQVRGQA